MNGTFLENQLQAYLALREALGFQMTAAKILLPEFVAFVQTQNSNAPISAQLALDWACQGSEHRGLSGSSQRLRIARQFLLFLQASLPDTEIPEPGLLPAPRRAVPYLFSPNEVVRLIDAARDSRRRTLRPHTLSTLLGLLASTGLRAGEAFRLQISDVKLDLDPPQLHILQTKFQKSRIVPLHESAARQLSCYVECRAQFHYDALSQAFFISERAGPLNHHQTQCWFRSLCERLAIAPKGKARGPCLTSFRHTFAVTCLRRWYQQGRDVQSLLPQLSVYLGHIKPQTSYWYLTAVPELLESAAQRFHHFAMVSGDGDE